jgi:hypothetical protein
MTREGIESRAAVGSIAGVGGSVEAGDCIDDAADRRCAYVPGAGGNDGRCAT